MAELLLEKLSKAYGHVWAVRDLSLTIHDGEFVTLLGPSGCGKTTTLRMIAGFVPPTTGRIVLAGRVISSAEDRIAVPPERRSMGMVFQSYAVWPHMTALENVAYPLRRARLPRVEVEARSRRALELVKLESLASRHPHELSGGQQQRIALARALVMEPAVLLLDEPLSNLDAKLREEMRFEIKDLQVRLGITVVYVTHDQAEAMVLSGRIAVMNTGRIMQVGTPVDLYERPADPFVGSFLGVANFLPGEVTERQDDGLRVRLLDGTGAHMVTVGNAMDTTDALAGRRPDAPSAGRVLVCIRPEAFRIGPDGELHGRVLRRTYLGSRVDYVVQLGTLTVRVEGPTSPLLAVGDEVSLAVQAALAYPHSTSATTSAGDSAT